MFLRLPLCAVAIALLFTIAGCGPIDPAAANKAALDSEYKTVMTQMLDINTQVNQSVDRITDADTSDMPEDVADNIQALSKQQTALGVRTTELQKQYAELGLTPPTMAEMGFDVSEIADQSLERLTQFDEKMNRTKN